DRLVGGGSSERARYFVSRLQALRDPRSNALQRVGGRDQSCPLRRCTIESGRFPRLRATVPLDQKDRPGGVPQALFEKSGERLDLVRRCVEPSRRLGRNGPANRRKSA